MDIIWRIIWSNTNKYFRSNLLWTSLCFVVTFIIRSLRFITRHLHTIIYTLGFVYFQLVAALITICWYNFVSKNIHLSEFTSIPTFAIPSVCTVWMSSSMLSRKWKLNHRPYMTVCYVWRELYLLRAYCNVYNTIFLMFHHCNLIWNCRCVSFVGWLYSYIASIQENRNTFFYFLSEFYQFLNQYQ